MSTQINQYVIYGINLPYQFHKDWEKLNPDKGDWDDNFDKFENDSAFTDKINHHDGIFCLFDGCNGNYIIIGRVLEKTDDHGYIQGPTCFQEPTEMEKEFIGNSITRNFGIDKPDMKIWFVTHYR
jgi:hypothetical protein